MYCESLKLKQLIQEGHEKWGILLRSVKSTLIHFLFYAKYNGFT